MLHDDRLPDAADLVVAESQLTAVRVGAMGSRRRRGVDAAVLYLRVLGRLRAEVLEACAARLDVAALEAGTPEVVIIFTNYD
jgi:hypothetical protein